MTELEIEIRRIANECQDEDKKHAQEMNDAPCQVCNSTEFVQKFRNVVGEISGRMQGSFSLCGGSVTGTINGYTKTLPVISCRKCENERGVAVWSYVYDVDVFWRFMHDFFFGIDENNSERLKNIDKFFLTRPLQVREFMIKHPHLDYKFYNQMPDWSPEIWARAGFKIPKIKKKYLFFWEKEVYPTWEKLQSLIKYYDPKPTNSPKDCN